MFLRGQHDFKILLPLYLLAVHTRKTSISNSTIFKSFHSRKRFCIDPFSLNVFGVVMRTVAAETKQYRFRLKTV